MRFEREISSRVWPFEAVTVGPPAYVIETFGALTSRK